MLPNDVSAYFAGQRVLVTGAGGFFGRHIVSLLQNIPSCLVIPAYRTTVDLTDAGQTQDFFSTHRPDVVIHAAARFGGTLAHQREPATIGWANMLMMAHVFESSVRCGARRVVGVMSDCAYPEGQADRLLCEDDLWSGPPHMSTGTYGAVKRLLPVIGEGYRRQYGLESIFVIPTNMYGPHDHFDPERSHVVAALIRKFVEAKLTTAEHVEIWGTGAPLRNFLFVHDAAEGTVRASALLPDSSIMNLAADEVTSIRVLAQQLAELTDFSGELVYNQKYSDGQLYKKLDTSRMQHFLGWKPPTLLVDGLRQTIQWYCSSRRS